MAKMLLNIRTAIGMKTTRDIFNDKGMLLIPSEAIILEEHIDILLNHGIQLSLEDVTEVQSAPTYHVDRIVDRSTERVSEFFDEIRMMKKVPLADFRHEVLPVVQEATERATLYDMFTSLKSKDDYTYRHNIAVAMFSSMLGGWLGMEKQELLQLTTAALLHDVGKMLVPEYILNKPGKLTDEEFEEVKKHTTYGYELLSNTTGITERQALVALQHHERLDGSGYPHGLHGDQIDLFSRIVAVADVFHAMTSRRVYQDQFPFYKVVSEIERSMFDSLDPAISIVFIEKIMSALIGSSILLSDGRAGKIVMVPKNYPTRPLIQVGEEFIDLTIHSDLQIEKINFR